jgi:TetR/AcrR family transcriptional repressor for divergent bdcA
VTDKKEMKRRGRPRAFDRDVALDQAQALFHAHGYDGVGVAALAEAMGINAPSLYGAFGSKAALFDEVLARYSDRATLADGLSVPGVDPAEALTDMLRMAAMIYAAHPLTAGCMVLEGARGTDADAAQCARQRKAMSVAAMADWLRPTHPAQADVVADYTAALMSGMSADARAGVPVDRLTAIADMGGMAIATMLDRERTEVDA